MMLQRFFGWLVDGHTIGPWKMKKSLRYERIEGITGDYVEKITSFVHTYGPTPFHDQGRAEVFQRTFMQPYRNDPQIGTEFFSKRSININPSPCV